MSNTVHRVNIGTLEVYVQAVDKPTNPTSLILTAFTSKRFRMAGFCTFVRCTRTCRDRSRYLCMDVTGSFTTSRCLQSHALQACLRCGQLSRLKAEAQANRGLVAAKLTTSEASLRRMELQAAALGEAASDIHAKVPGPVSARPGASVKSRTDM